MRVLCLDYGSARCGVAVSDPTGTVATPLDVIERPDSEAGMERIVDQAIALDVERIVVGLPVLMSGEEGSQARAARSFAGRLRKLADRPVELFDERFTTRMAERTRLEGAIAHEDSLAAAHLLRSFLTVHIDQDDDE